MQASAYTTQLFCTFFVLVCLCADSNFANASCGDYLYTKHSKPAKPLATASTQTSESLPQNPAGKQPCSGPDCRRDRTPLPLNLPVVNIVPLSPEGCANSEALLSPDDCQSHRPARHNGSQCIGHPMQIDRPPQQIC